MKKLLTVALSLGLLLSGAVGCKKNKPEAADTSEAQGIPLFSQSYPADPATFVPNLKRLAAPRGGESNQNLLARFFKENNIAIDPPAAVFLDEGGKRLLVRAPQSDKEKVQALVERIQKGQ